MGVLSESRPDQFTGEVEVKMKKQIGESHQRKLPTGISEKLCFGGPVLLSMNSEQSTETPELNFVNHPLDVNKDCGKNQPAHWPLQ